MLRETNFSKKVSITSSAIIILLAACGTSSAGGTSPTINLTNVNSTAQAAAATLFAQTLAPTVTATVTPTNTPTPTLTPPPFKAIDGLRVTYIIDGNLHIQDSGKPAVQLTYTGQDSFPEFTDDGQKIIFFRTSESRRELYTINSDGTSERVLVNSNLLMSLGLDYDEFTELSSTVIIPHTHQILFNTKQLNPTQTKSNYDLLLADIDTGNIKRLVNTNQGGRFLVSPNGKLIAIEKIDHIDVINLQGKMFNPNLVTHSPIDDYYGIWWAEMFWTDDSSELIVLPTDIPPGTGIAMVRTVWQYPVNGNQGVEIKLNPPPSNNAFTVSPDGNWIVYSYTLGQKALIDISPDRVTWDPNTQLGIYLGNLHDGTSKLLYAAQSDETGRIDVPEEYAGWCPDGSHFMVVSNNKLYMGDIYGELVLFRPTPSIGWIDNNHYLMPGGVIGEVGKEELFKALELPPGMFFPSNFIFLGN